VEGKVLEKSTNQSPTNTSRRDRAEGEALMSDNPLTNLVPLVVGETRDPEQRVAAIERFTEALEDYSEKPPVNLNEFWLAMLSRLRSLELN
jgi:hypothetical protein